MARVVPISTADIRQLRAWAEVVSRKVNSLANVNRQDKISILATNKLVKDWCDKKLQLELFAPGALVGE